MPFKDADVKREWHKRWREKNRDFVKSQRLTLLFVLLYLHAGFTRA